MRTTSAGALEILAAGGYDGVLSLECEGMGGPMIEQSLDWLRGAVAQAADGIHSPQTGAVRLKRSYMGGWS